MGQAKVKDQSIETLRGITIILVVGGYILGLPGDSPALSFLKIVNHCVLPLRMPLFTVISAYLYASSPATQETVKKLISGKFRRLLFPFLAVSTIQYVLFSVFHFEDTPPLAQIFRIYAWPFMQFWFVLAIFWIFLVVGFLDSKKALDTKEKWFGWLVLAFISHTFFDPPQILAVSGVNYLIPYFLLGYGIRRFSKEFMTPGVIRIFTYVAIVSYGVFIYFRDLPMNSLPFKALAVVCVLSIIPLVFHFRPNIPWLAKIGHYAFGIYIFNRISTMLPEMVFEKLGIANSGLTFTISLIFAVACSIGLQILLEKFAVTRMYILGMKK